MSGPSFPSSPADAGAVREEPRGAGSAEGNHASPVERRRLIIEAAYGLLAEGGLEGLTVRAVLGRTGLARRAFYECFGGKDDLVLSLFEHTIQLAADRLGEEVCGIADPFERLRLILTEIVMGRASPGEDMAGADRRGAALSREHLRLAQTRPAELENALRPLIALIAAQLSDGMDAGTMRRQQPQRLAVLVYNLVSTTVQTELLAQEAGQSPRVSRDEIARELWDFCRRAVSV